MKCTQYLAAISLAISLSFGMVFPAPTRACVDHPPITTITGISICPAGATITVTFDPWQTFSASAGQTCVCAIRVPSSVAFGVSGAQTVVSGTSNSVPGFGPWIPSPATAALVESMRPAGPGNQWFALRSDLTGSVAAGTLVDFQITYRINPGVNVQTLQSALEGDGSDRLFTDEAEPDGTPKGTHGGFVSVCLAGNVNLGTNLGPIADVLFVNGSAGGLNRTVQVPTGQSLSVSLNSAPAGPAMGRYVMWAWLGRPVAPTTLIQNGAMIGCFANPTPFAGSPAPVTCLISSGLPPAACGGVSQGTSPSFAPWQVTHPGLPTPQTFTIQGLLEDQNAANSSQFSVTNAVILDVQ